MILGIATSITPHKEKTLNKLYLFLLATLLMMPVGLFAQQNPTQAPGKPSQAPAQSEQKQAGTNPQKMGHCYGMMSEHAQEMKQMDARLQEKVAAMDAAKGDQKIEAMAAVIKELVAQRHEMHERMMKMREKGMGPHHHRKGMEGMKTGTDSSMPMQEKKPQ